MARTRPAYPIIQGFEYLRLASVFMGIFAAFSDTSNAAYYLLLGMLLPMSGLLAIEGLFFSEYSARYKNREPSVYQLQSALFFVSLFVVSVTILLLHAGLQAQISMIAVMVLFFLLSSLVHLKEFIQHKQRLHLWRFIGSVLMCLVVFLAIWMQVQA